MGRFVINGGAALTGEVSVSGAKNEALKVIPFSILVNGSFVLENVPDIADIRKQLEIFKDLGGEYEFKDNTLTLNGTGVTKSTLKNGLATSLRASVVYLGPLLAKFGKVTIPFPGGCAIGSRPIEAHLKAFEDLGAKTKLENETYEITFNEFISSRITLLEQSVTATENILLFLSYFEEDFEISNCAIEPEILALCQILNNAGAKIETLDERTFKIRGSRELRLTSEQIVPDRIEAFSYLVAFLVTAGEGKIKNFPSSFMQKPLEELKKAGANFSAKSGEITILKADQFKPFNIKTAPYPGFPTDMQSPMSLIGALCSGESTIEETMFENRLGYISQLEKMGLEAEIKNNIVKIKGPKQLHGARITSPDLRSGITLVLAALMAQGKSVIVNSEIIDRGYENLVNKLEALGADIKRDD